MAQGLPVPVLGTTVPAPKLEPVDDSKSRTNLIINYIPPSATDDDLKDFFSKVGPVQSVKIVRDKATRASLGYAFVNYISPGDAARAVQSLDGVKANGKTLKVSFARPSSQTIKNANLYIAHIPKHWDTEALKSFFSPYGSIIQSKVLLDQMGQSRGCGFVRFDQNGQAESAIAALNGTTPPGSTVPLVVKYANTQSSTQPASPTSGAIPTLTTLPTVPAIRPKLGAGGPIRSAVQSSSRFNPIGLAPGPSTPATVPPTPPAFQHTTVPGLVQNQFGSQTWCVFVYNLPPEAEDTTLYQLFSPFGAISSVKVIKDPSNTKPKGYGFVNMMNYEEAFQAILALNGTMLDGKVLQVSFKTAKKNNE